MSSDALELGVGIAGTSIEILSLKMETEIMTDFITLVNDLAAVVGTDTKQALAFTAELKAFQGDLANLPTNHKATLVGSIIELQSNINAVSAQTDIDDTIIDGGSTWSSTKINAAITASINGLVGNAPEALDTIAEIATALSDNPDVVSALQAGLAKRIRFDAEQTLTAAEKIQVRSNIGAAAITDLNALSAEISTLKLSIGDIANANFVDTYNTAKTA